MWKRPLAEKPYMQLKIGENLSEASNKSRENLVTVMIKYFMLVLLVCAISVSHAGEQLILKEGAEIYPVRTDGQRDWQANHYRVENGQAVPIRTDGQRDWSANVYRAEGDRVVPVRPDGQRDWKAPDQQH